MSKVYVIAEAGVNHNGSVAMAMELIDRAAEAGADAVKFQTFRAEELVSRQAKKADYQARLTDKEESQLVMLKKLELDETSHRTLIEHCRKKQIQFLSTPFDLKSVDFLARSLELPRLKIGSGDITNGPLLLKVARTGKPIILSTGMSYLGETELALAILAFGYSSNEGKPGIHSFYKAYVSDQGREKLERNVTLLHCTTEYPAPFADVNLLAMDTLRVAFGLPVGLSDHTPGIAIPIAAVARGAQVIEKHFTLDRSLPGPDHQASLEPEELKAMVMSIRQVEAALGSPLKVPASSELKNQGIARRSLTAAREIRPGEIFTEENLTVKRPGTGISPMQFWEWLGKPAHRGFLADDIID